MQLKQFVWMLTLLTPACGGAAIDATADPAMPLVDGHGLVAGRLSTLGCPDHRSLFDRATGGGDTRVVVLSKDGQYYRVDADVASDYFAAALPAGRYELTAFRVESAMGQDTWSPKQWFVEVEPERAAYVGSIRFVCLDWRLTGTRVEAKLRISVVQELEAARHALGPTFPEVPVLIDRSESLALRTATPRSNGFAYELFLREDSTTKDVPNELLGAVRALAQNPRPTGSVPTQNDWEFRVQRGDWEALYLLDESARLVLVTELRKTRSPASGRLDGEGR